MKIPFIFWMIQVDNYHIPKLKEWEGGDMDIIIHKGCGLDVHKDIQGT